MSSQLQLQLQQKLLEHLQTITEVLLKGDNSVIAEFIKILGIAIGMGVGFSLIAVLLGGGLFKVLGYFRSMMRF